ncbi:hypothetical protein DID78_04315 [Candidatus Marinamargulisbacteria bacterium SCGC AG-343-D04]|nr:hypothetical protein DID78_04315 [Candidatus Marinamargulisbacteria bacterium SCGC AG-343-D04]
MIALIKKDLSFLFKSSIGYLYILTFFSFSYWYYSKYIFIHDQATMTSFFYISHLLLLVLIPAITMRSWSEDKRSGMLDFLKTFPLTEWEHILSKFASALLFFLLILVSTLPLIILPIYFGNPDIGLIVSGYIALFLLGSSLISIGLFTSSLTKNQMLSFLFSLGINYGFYFLSTPLFINSMPSYISRFSQLFSINYHYTYLSKGVLDFHSAFFFILLTFFFLFLNNIVFHYQRAQP